MRPWAAARDYRAAALSLICQCPLSDVPAARRDVGLVPCRFWDYTKGVPGNLPADSNLPATVLNRLGSRFRRDGNEPIQRDCSFLAKQKRQGNKPGQKLQSPYRPRPKSRARTTTGLVRLVYEAGPCRNNDTAPLAFHECRRLMVAVPQCRWCDRLTGPPPGLGLL
jgi:hypothetical protein